MALRLIREGLKINGAVYFGIEPSPPPPLVPVADSDVAWAVDPYTALASHENFGQIQAVQGALLGEADNHPYEPNGTHSHASIAIDGSLLRFGQITDPTDATRTVWKFALHRDDDAPWPPGSTSGPRTEIAHMGAGLYLPLGTEFWQGYRVWHKAWTSADNQIISQWHAMDSIASPPFLACYIDNGVEKWSVRNDSGTTNYVNASFGSLMEVWYDIVIHAKIGADGFVNVYRNGILLFTHQGAVGYAADTAPYAKTGIYHWIDSGNTWDGTAERVQLLSYACLVTSGTYSMGDIRQHVLAKSVAPGTEPVPEPEPEPEPEPTGPTMNDDGLAGSGISGYTYDSPWFTPSALTYLPPAQIGNLRTVHLTATGSSAGDGSLAAPWSLQHYLTSEATPGDRAIVYAGTHTLTSSSYTIVGTAANPIRIFADPAGARPVIQNSNSGGYSVCHFRNSSYFGLHGLDFNGRGSTGNTWGLTFGRRYSSGSATGDPLRGECHHVDVWHCKMRNVRQETCKVGGGYTTVPTQSHHFHIHGCEFTEAGRAASSTEPYGELFYLGDGQYSDDKPEDISIEWSWLHHNSWGEAIDCKSEPSRVRLAHILVNDIQVPSQAAITAWRVNGGDYEYVLVHDVVKGNYDGYATWLGGNYVAENFIVWNTDGGACAMIKRAASGGNVHTIRNWTCWNNLRTETGQPGTFNKDFTWNGDSNDTVVQSITATVTQDGDEATTLAISSDFVGPITGTAEAVVDQHGSGFAPSSTSSIPTGVGANITSGETVVEQPVVSLTDLTTGYYNNANSYIGQLFAISGPGNIKLQGDTQVAQPFVARETGLINEFAWVNKYDTVRTGYHDGNGGYVRVRLCGSDANGMPNEANVITSHTITSPITSDPDGYASRRSFDSDGAVTKGVKYWLVFDNTYPTSDTDYVSINLIYREDGTYPTTSGDPDYFHNLITANQQFAPYAKGSAHYAGTSNLINGWGRGAIRRHYCVFEVFYKSGLRQGNSYLGRATTETTDLNLSTSMSTFWRQKFTVERPRTAYKAHMRLLSNTTCTPRLTITRADGSAVATIDLNEVSQCWRSKTLTTPIRFNEGVYYAVISAASGSGTLRAVGAARHAEWFSDGQTNWGGEQNYVEKGSGSSWSVVANVGADAPMFFETRARPVDVYLVGDSITNHSTFRNPWPLDLAAQSPAMKQVYNNSVSGRKASEGVSALTADAARVDDADTLVSNLGINDSTSNTTATEYKAQVKDICNYFRSLRPWGRVVWVKLACNPDVATQEVKDRVSQRNPKLEELLTEGVIDALVHWDDYTLLHPEVWYGDEVHIYGTGSEHYSDQINLVLGAMQ